MKIIEQSHEILSIPEDLLKMIEKVGRTCYKSEDRITEGSAEKFVTMLIKRKHEAMVEFGDIIVKFVTNRGVTHELVRHRLCSFAQESTRYVNYKGGMEVIKPVWWDDVPSETNLVWTVAMESCERAYMNLLNEGWQAQQAREVLPNALKTEINVKANIREWRAIFGLRCAKAAHPQIRHLMLNLLKELKQKVPIVFDDICIDSEKKGK